MHANANNLPPRRDVKTCKLQADDHECSFRGPALDWVVSSCVDLTDDHLAVGWLCSYCPTSSPIFCAHWPGVLHEYASCKRMQVARRIE